MSVMDSIQPYRIEFFYNFIIFKDKYQHKMNIEGNYIYSTPVKAQKLFLNFASEQPSTQADIVTKSQQSNSTISPFTPLKTSDPFKLISVNSSLQVSSGNDSNVGGDRYIPQRKLVKKESMMSEDDLDVEAENKNFSCEEGGVSVSDLYRRFVMTESPKKKRPVPIESFQNNNILKFAKIPSNSENSQLIPHESGLRWTDDVEKESPRGRKVNKLPVKVLDAPSLQDDYYLNLLDWGTQNFLAVGLSSSVYLWNAANSKVNKLCDLGSSQVTGVGWASRDASIAIGSESGQVQIWDINKLKKVRTMTGHSNRVGAISWGSSFLSTGSRDKTILNRDIRQSSQFVSRFEGHRQEVCGLKWSPDDQQLCSGGNDNKLLVWSPKTNEPVLKFCDHQAAVKAVAWSPHQHGLLVSGGGTADRTIRFRNTLTGTTTKIVEAGSQVCCLMFSRVSQELVSTHGYQMNEINLWKMPTMSKVASLTGHSSRVLYLAMSADGTTVVTGAGDQTLRFWNLFPGKGQGTKKNGGLLQGEGLFLR